MANFFDEERLTCSKCKTQVFEEFQSLILVKDRTIYEKQPYKKMYRCVGCGQIQDIKVRE